MNDLRRRLDAWLQTVDAVLAAQEKQTPAPDMIGKLWVRLRKETDLELHVRTGWVFGTEFVQLVDFVPSAGKYENAVLIERGLLGRLLEELVGLHRHSSTARGHR